MTFYYTINIFIIGGIIAATVVLSNVVAKLVNKSEIHSDAEKRKMVLMCWLLPIMGPLICASRLKEDAAKNQEKVDQQLVESLNELTKKIDSMREQIQREKQQPVENPNKDKQKNLH